MSKSYESMKKAELIELMTRKDNLLKVIIADRRELRKKNSELRGKAENNVPSTNKYNVFVKRNPDNRDWFDVIINGTPRISYPDFASAQARAVEIRKAH